MRLDGGEKEAVRKLSDAVNLAVERSPEVSDAIETLRSLGFEPDLSLKLEIGLHEMFEDLEDLSKEILLDLSEDDLRELSRMKIKVN